MSFPNAVGDLVVWGVRATNAASAERLLSTQLGRLGGVSFAGPPANPTSLTIRAPHRLGGDRFFQAFLPGALAGIQRRIGDHPVGIPAYSGGGQVLFRHPPQCAQLTPDGAIAVNLIGWECSHRLILMERLYHALRPDDAPFAFMSNPVLRSSTTLLLGYPEPPLSDRQRVIMVLGRLQSWFGQDAPIACVTHRQEPRGWGIVIADAAAILSALTGLVKRVPEITWDADEWSLLVKLSPAVMALPAVRQAVAGRPSSPGAGIIRLDYDALSAVPDAPANRHAQQVIGWARLLTDLYQRLQPADSPFIRYEGGALLVWVPVPERLSRDGVERALDRLFGPPGPVRHHAITFA